MEEKKKKSLRTPKRSSSHPRSSKSVKVKVPLLEIHCGDSWHFNSGVAKLKPRFGIDNGFGAATINSAYKGKNGDLVARDKELVPKPRGSLKHMATGNKDAQDVYAPPG